MATTGTVTSRVLIGWVALVLAPMGCESGGTGGVASSADAVGDLGSPPATTCSQSVFDIDGAACPADGATCTGYAGTWCGEPAVEGECECQGGVWDCTAAGPHLSPCHDCCERARGAGWVCGADGVCREATTCLADASSCCPANASMLVGEPCPAALEALECNESAPWCGGEMLMAMCTCQQGEWACSMAGAPDPCHACCQQAHDETWFCTIDGDCTQADLCEAVDCCVPGPGGDAYCQGSFGDCSRCAPTEGSGRCEPTSC